MWLKSIRRTKWESIRIEKKITTIKINVLAISVILLLLATLVQASGIVARNPPSACKAPDSECACSEGDDVQNGCIKVLLNMGSTTPWTGSKPCALKVFSDDMSPQVFTLDSLYAVCGYTLLGHLTR